MSIIADTARGEIKFINGVSAPVDYYDISGKEFSSTLAVKEKADVCDISVSGTAEMNNSRITELENQLEELTKRLNELVELKVPRDNEIIEAIEVSDEDFLALLNVDGERHG